MKNKVICNSLNGMLTENLELEELEKRLEMLVLKPILSGNGQVGGCDDICGEVCDIDQCHDHPCHDECDGYHCHDECDRDYCVDDF